MFGNTSSDKKSYEVLLAEAKTGNRISAGILAERQARFSYRRAWLAIHNEHDAQELAQEAVLRVQRNLPTIVHFQAYAKTTIDSLIIDHVKKRRLDTSPFDGTLGTAPEPIANAKLLEDEVLHRAEMQRTLAAIDDLPELFDKEVVRLRYFDNLKFREIAKAVDRSESAVKKCLARSLAILKAKLAPHSRHDQ